LSIEFARRNEYYAYKYENEAKVFTCNEELPEYGLLAEIYELLIEIVYLIY
jgi:hypothetical protein